MIKRLKLMLFLVAFIVVVMVGCASNQTPKQTTTQQPAGQTEVSAENVANGKKLFDTNCLSCHSTDNTAKIGPGLKGIYSKNKLPNGNPVNDTNLAQWMKIGNEKIPGNAALSIQDTSDIDSYLKTLK